MSRPLTWFVNSPLWRWLLQRRCLPPLLRAVGNERPKRILEVGCGFGDTTRMLLERFPGAVIAATDADAAQIGLARRRVRDPRAAFAVADAAALPYADDSFDLVAEFNTFHHVREWRRAIGECARVLKPGGVFVAMDENTFAWGRLYTWFTRSEGVFAKADYAEAARAAGLILERDLGSERIMRFVFRK
jgi:ubiquinone/menaquinone biosynthesis C-methylase UbiE